MTPDSNTWKRAEVKHVDEPFLTFGFGQSLRYAKDGLFLFGPLVDEQKPAEIRAGVVGTESGIDRYRRWVQKIGQFIPPGAQGAQHHTAFPGFEAIFKTSWSARPLAELKVSTTELERAIRISDRHERVFKTVDLFEAPIRRHMREEDAAPALWFVVIPEDIHRFCRPRSTVPKLERIPSKVMMTAARARRLEREPLLSFLADDMRIAQTYGYDVDFHNQLKARLLDQRAVIQIARETTLTPEDFEQDSLRRRRLQDPQTSLGTSARLPSSKRADAHGR